MNGDGGHPAPDDGKGRVMEKRSEMTMEELLTLPVIIDFKTAFRALGVGHTEAYRLAAAGEFEAVTGCPVRQRGTVRVVTRPDLFRALGLDPGMVRAPEAEAS